LQSYSPGGANTNISGTKMAESTADKNVRKIYYLKLQCHV